MSGYIRNNGDVPVFIAQRSMPQGRSVDFEELLKVFSRKSACSEVTPVFVVWLRENIFKDSHWGFYNVDGSEYEFPENSVSEKEEAVEEEVPVETFQEQSSVSEAKGAGRVLRRNSDNTKGLQITPSVIIEAKPDKVKDLVNRCRDRAVLKKALALTHHFSKKEEHQRQLIRRLNEVVV